MSKIGEGYFIQFQNDIIERIQFYVKLQASNANSLNSTVQALLKFYKRILEQMIVSEVEKSPETVLSLL